MVRFTASLISVKLGKTDRVMNDERYIRFSEKAHTSVGSYRHSRGKDKQKKRDKEESMV